MIKSGILYIITFFIPVVYVYIKKRKHSNKKKILSSLFLGGNIGAIGYAGIMFFIDLINKYHLIENDTIASIIGFLIGLIVAISYGFLIHFFVELPINSGQKKNL